METPVFERMEPRYDHHLPTGAAGVGDVGGARAPRGASLGMGGNSDDRREEEYGHGIDAVGGPPRSDVATAANDRYQHGAGAYPEIGAEEPRAGKWSI